ncbi:DNA-formamidopyrimidine glycosylase family protein [Actinomadura rugatobispora]|uniref:DNA-(apurinic or apyrimidinic site) lyase n=1 Tax=Actinomadura rugatobispora TaxID=1994 RepID=A0ABW1ACZ1_9ACTN|nr:Fpg/Nei family DNA glycosylase [Actinomadura rugatobispora]
MPEGDAVWLTARRLREALAGRVLTRSDFRVPRLATADLRGRTVEEVVSRGKHLLIRVGPPPGAGAQAAAASSGTGGGLTVHTHLLMDGRWRIREAGPPPPRDHRLRAVLANAEWQALGYSLGILEIFPTGQESRVVDRLGPDLLDPGWSPALAAEAVRRLSERPERPIGEALLDQSLLAGIGNVYKAEILFLRGVDPWTPVRDVPDLPAVVDLSRRLLNANKERHGHITTGDRRPGREHWVYGRAGRPCRRCGARVRRADQDSDAGERVTFWCPRCQPPTA